MSAATLKLIRLHVVSQLLLTIWPNKVGLFRATSLARHLLQFAEDSSVAAMDKMDLIVLVRDIMPLWDQRDKNYQNRDLQPKLWDEIGEKLNVTG
jgi:hypothetical protein